MDVGQGDGALLISPLGQTVLFDHGVLNRCDLPLNYLAGLGVAAIDYMVTSHYHADHIGCTQEILQQFPLLNTAFDRGDSYSSATFSRYIEAVGDRRVTASQGTTLTLDAGSPNPVTITVIAVNGDGIATTDENSLSLVAVVQYGNFRAEIGGDLVGIQNGAARDIESGVAPRVGPVDVYKVHHHCSRYSTNLNWVAMTQPTIGIVSTGDTNTYGHPTQDCLDRLHGVGTITYWTESGNGAAPDPSFDIVAAGRILVETNASDVPQIFTVTYQNTTDVYPTKPR